MNSSLPTSFSAEEEGGVWELRHDDDGFTYKILKKLRLSEPEQPVTAPDPKAETKHRRERKRKILLKLKSEYQREIESWELLSNTLRGMEERAKQNLELQKQKQNETASSSVVEVEGAAEGCGSSLIDELLWKAEAQEAIIRDVSNLCDVAEAISDAREQQLAQSFIDLPVWSSPRELMESLCDSDEHSRRDDENHEMQSCIQ